jgi:hypothetical protein
MNKIDSSITAPLISVYIGIMGLIFINIFVALLSSKFSRVYDRAEEYVTLQRAIEKSATEVSMVMLRFSLIKAIFLRNKSFNEFLRSTYNPYEERKNNLRQISLDDCLEDIENQLVNILFKYLFDVLY